MSLPKNLPHTSILSMLFADRFLKKEGDADAKQADGADAKHAESAAADFAALEQEMVEAIHAETLDVADVQVRDDTRQLPAIEGWRSLGNDIGKLNGVRTWMSNQGMVRYILKPKPFRDWLQRTGRLPLPDGCELAEWCGAEAQAEPVAGATRPGPRTRKDRLAVAIERAMEAKPCATADELFDWMKENDETGCIVDYDDDKLVWEDTERNEHDIPRRTFANRVSRIKTKQG